MFLFSSSYEEKTLSGNLFYPMPYFYVKILPIFFLLVVSQDKLVVLQAGALVYFDETDHTSATNLAAKVISLAACQVKRSEPEAGGFFSSSEASVNEFTLITPSRDFIFSSEEVGDWVKAIQSEIDAGAALTQEERKSSPDDE